MSPPNSKCAIVFATQHAVERLTVPKHAQDSEFETETWVQFEREQRFSQRLWRLYVLCQISSRSARHHEWPNPAILRHVNKEAGASLPQHPRDEGMGKSSFRAFCLLRLKQMLIER